MTLNLPPNFNDRRPIIYVSFRFTDPNGEEYWGNHEIKPDADATLLSTLRIIAHGMARTMNAQCGEGTHWVSEQNTKDLPSVTVQ